MANPTIRRDAMSITVARYSQPFPGRDVGDVPAPAGVDRRGVHGEVPAHQIRTSRGSRVGNRRALEAARGASVQAGGAHQPRDPAVAVAVAVTAQLRVDPRGAVAALGSLVGLADVLGELLVDQLPGRGLSARWA
jgi:hypothetical protein